MLANSSCTSSAVGLFVDLTSPESADSTDGSLWTGVGVERREAADDGVGLDGGSGPPPPAVERSEP